MTDKDKKILDFEARTYRYAGAKEAAIRGELDMTAVRYWQRLNELLDQPAALEYSPSLVNRLRRLRVQRNRARAA